MFLLTPGNKLNVWVDVIRKRSALTSATRRQLLRVSEHHKQLSQKCYVLFCLSNSVIVIYHKTIRTTKKIKELKHLTVRPQAS